MTAPRYVPKLISETTPARQAAIFVGRREAAQESATVEKVFGNIGHNKGLDRFTVRGREKVDGQWNPMCRVHNIEKLAHHGYGR